MGYFENITPKHFIVRETTRMYAHDRVKSEIDSLTIILHQIVDEKLNNIPVERYTSEEEWKGMVEDWLKSEIFDPMKRLTTWKYKSINIWSDSERYKTLKKNK